jgi:3-polyprenyl-4-hydroxybenzoate decarboxylase
MRRIMWVAVGAAGGILAYRRLQQALEDARERGVVMSVQQVGLSAMQAAGSARALASGALSAVESRGTASAPASASAAAHVMNQSYQRGM